MLSIYFFKCEDSFTLYVLDCPVFCLGKVWKTFYEGERREAWWILPSFYEMTVCCRKYRWQCLKYQLFTNEVLHLSWRPTCSFEVFSFFLRFLLNWVRMLSSTTFPLQLHCHFLEKTKTSVEARKHSKWPKIFLVWFLYLLQYLCFLGHLEFPIFGFIFFYISFSSLYYCFCFLYINIVVTFIAISPLIQQALNVKSCQYWIMIIEHRLVWQFFVVSCHSESHSSHSRWRSCRGITLHSDLLYQTSCEAAQHNLPLRQHEAVTDAFYPPHKSNAALLWIVVSKRELLFVALWHIKC